MLNSKLTRHLRVLIAEDNLNDADLLVQELRRSGFDFSWNLAANEKELFLGLEPSPDLILAEYCLEELDAFRILQAVKEGGLRVPVIVISGSDEGCLAGECIQLGAADFVARSELGSLGIVIARILERWDEPSPRRDLAAQAKDQSLLGHCRVLFDHTWDMVLITRPTDGRIVEANRAAELAYGYTRPELLALNIHDLYAPEAQSQILTQIRRSMMEEVVFETLQQRKDGSVFPAEINSAGAFIGNTRVSLNVVRDITERQQAEDAARQRELYLDQMVRQMPFPSVVCAADGATAVEIDPPGYPLGSGEGSYAPRFQDIPVFPGEAPHKTLWQPVSSWKDLSERRLAEQDLVRRLNELEALRAIAVAGTEATCLADLVEKVSDIITAKLYPDAFGIAFLDEEAGWLAYQPMRREGAEVPGRVQPIELGIAGAAVRSGAARRCGDVRLDPDYVAQHPATLSELCVPITIGSQVIGVIDAEDERLNAFTEADERLLVAVAGELGTAVEKIRLLEATQSQNCELETLARITTAVREGNTLKEMLPPVLDSLYEVLHAYGVAIAMRDRRDSSMVFERGRGNWEAIEGARLPAGEGIGGMVASIQQMYMSVDVQNDPALRQHPLMGPVKCMLCLPLIAEGKTIGLAYVGRNSPFSPSEVRLARATAELAASAFHRIQLHEQTEQQLRRLTTLRAIDKTILSTLDLQVTLDFLLERITANLGVDAANFLLYDPVSKTLNSRRDRGLPPVEFQNYHLELGQSHAGKAALERKMEIVLDMGQLDDDLTTRMERCGDRFTSYIAVPLEARGNLKGVLQLFHRTRLDPGPDWMDFLQLLSGMAAIAIDNAQLFIEQQQANLKLTRAYDDTIEGWSSALDLRDEETAGHSRRVTELTLRLAERLGIPQEQIPHIRRGAQLHDIGKLGIPDSILSKPGPLSEEEWQTMHQHPVYAHDLFSPIEYLQPALDIPYCHHEKWDGSGYPRGLKGEEIPLAARIFSIVDFWDALTHWRPYREAWEPRRIIAAIREQAGKHFDPRVVEHFLALIEADGIST